MYRPDTNPPWSRTVRLTKARKQAFLTHLGEHGVAREATSSRSFTAAFEGKFRQREEDAFFVQGART
jgi:hypothetical protein